MGVLVREGDLVVEREWIPADVEVGLGIKAHMELTYKICKDVVGRYS